MKERTQKFEALKVAIKSNDELIASIEKHEGDRDFALSVNGSYKIMTGSIKADLIKLLEAHGAELRKQLEEV